MYPKVISSLKAGEKNAVIQRVTLCVPVALAALLSPLQARGQSNPTARLELIRGQGAEACPGEQDLRDAVVMRLGHDPFTPHAAQRLIVVLSGSGTQLFGDISIPNAAGKDWSSRVVEPSPDCTRLITGIGLALSLALAPLPVPPRSALTATTAQKGPPVGDAQPLHRTTPATRGPAASRPPAQPLPPTTPWGFEASLGGGMSVGPTPDPAGGLAVGLGTTWGRWSFGLEARGYFATSEDAPEGGRVQVALITGALVTCRTVVGPLFLCGVVSAGGLVAEGLGVDVPEDDATPYLGMGARMGGNFPLASEVALRVHLDGTFAPIESDVYLRNTVVFTSSRGAFGFGGGLVKYF
jgi:hypothetical protein